VGVDGSGTLYI